MFTGVTIKKYILISGAFLLLLFCFLVTKIYAHESENEDVQIIHIDEKGFSPAKIEIKKGTIITFENTGKEDHWPASDDHPSHTLYDGTSMEEHCSSGHDGSFDACKAITSGTSWSFEFSKTGTYTLHDHLWPQLTGEIIVVDAHDVRIKNSFFTQVFSYIRRAFYSLINLVINKKQTPVLESGAINTEFYTKLKRRFEHIVLDSDPHEAIHTLREDSQKDLRVMALCHDVLHVIGHTAYAKYGSFKEAVIYQEDFCNSGYIHGLFESYFKTAKDPLEGLSEQCSEYGGGKRLFDLWQCHHGIGHGFMYLTGGDLDESLELCQTSLKDEESISSCQNGAYMELFNSEVLPKEKKFIDADNPFSTCETREMGKADCYLYIPTYLSQIKGKDFVDIVKECSRAEDGYESVCIQGVGSEAIKRNMNNVESVLSVCKLAGSKKNEQACIGGAVSMYMNQEGSLKAGKELCEQMSGRNREACNATVASKEQFFK